jgi:hypothetical protein
MSGAMKSSTPGWTGGSTKSDECGATTMLRQMVRHGARAGGVGIAEGMEDSG